MIFQLVQPTFKTLCHSHLKKFREAKFPAIRECYTDTKDFISSYHILGIGLGDLTLFTTLFLVGLERIPDYPVNYLLH